MKKPVKCYQCGKQYELKASEAKEIISCSHCHKQMHIDEASKKKFRLVRYLFVLVICLLIALGMNMVTNNNYTILLVTLMIAMIFANYSDKWCLILTDMIFGLSYEEYVPVKYSKKEIRKMRSQKKKGLFK